MARKRPRLIENNDVRMAESVCFEVRVNGRRACRAGFTGYGILDASLTWLRRHPRRDPDQADLLSLHVGAVDHTEPAWNRQLFWDLPTVQVGDRIELRVTEGQTVDAPGVKRVRVQPRLEPPRLGDPSRTDVGGATMWLEPRGLCLRTHDPRWGGPTILAPAEARRLASALLDAAGGPSRPNRRSRPSARRKGGRS